MKKIPIKNYIILAVILLATIISVFYARSWYITNEEYYLRNSAIKDTVREINIDEISNYNLESPRFILYISSGGNAEIKKFESDFKKVIKKLEISDDIVYLNADNVEELYTRLKDYSNNDKMDSYIKESDASLYIFDNGKIVSVLNNVNHFSDKQIEKYIKKWGFIGD